MDRIASVLFSYYPADPRPRREMEALVEAGMTVDILCLKGEGEKDEEQINGVNVFRLPAIRTRSGKLRYFWEYGWFFLLAGFRLSMLHIKRSYQVVHVHNMPDVLVFCSLLPRVCGAKIILDLHDPMPELYMTKYSISDSHPVTRLLRFLERQSIRFADIVLTPNIAFRDLFVFRGCPDWKIHIVMNSPQEMIFNRNSIRQTHFVKNRFMMMYHGTIAERNGLDTALEAIDYVRGEIPNLRFEVYGEGDFVKPFLKRVEELNLASVVHFHGYQSLEAIAQAIQTIDVGIIPNKMSPFTNLNFPTRIFEYLSMGKPVIAPRTKGILDYFDEHSLHFFEPGHPQSLAERMVDVYRSHAEVQEVLVRGLRVYENYRWEGQQKYYVHLVKELVGRHR